MTSVRRKSRTELRRAEWNLVRSYNDYLSQLRDAVSSIDALLRSEGPNDQGRLLVQAALERAREILEKLIIVQRTRHVQLNIVFHQLFSVFQHLGEALISVSRIFDWQLRESCASKYDCATYVRHYCSGDKKIEDVFAGVSPSFDSSGKSKLAVSAGSLFVEDLINICKQCNQIYDSAGGITEYAMKKNFGASTAELRDIRDEVRQYKANPAAHKKELKEAATKCDSVFSKIKAKVESVEDKAFAQLASWASSFDTWVESGGLEEGAEELFRVWEIFSPSGTLFEQLRSQVLQECPDVRVPHSPREHREKEDKPTEKEASESDDIEPSIPNKDGKSSTPKPVDLEGSSGGEEIANLNDSHMSSFVSRDPRSLYPTIRQPGSRPGHSRHHKDRHRRRRSQNSTDSSSFDLERLEEELSWVEKLVRQCCCQKENSGPGTGKRRR